MTGENTSTEPAVADATTAERTSPVALAAASEPGSEPRHRSESAERKFGYYWGLGRRKSAVARVRLREGSGKFLINSRPHEEYFKNERDREDITAPLKVADIANRLDVFVNVRGGGTTGQAGAVVLGLARALRSYDSELELALRGGRFLTRDSRKVERKKYGQSGARRRFQFSKR